MQCLVGGLNRRCQSEPFDRYRNPVFDDFIESIKSLNQRVALGINSIGIIDAQRPQTFYTLRQIFCLSINSVRYLPNGLYRPWQSSSAEPQKRGCWPLDEPQ